MTRRLGPGDTVNKAKRTPDRRRDITLDPAHSGFDATNGAEQPVYHRASFYLSIPE